MQRGGSKHEVQMAFIETTIYMVISHQPTSAQKVGTFSLSAYPHIR